MSAYEQLVAALEGVVDGQMYPLKAPQKTVAPYIVYSHVAGVPDTMLDGTTPIEQSRYQLDVYSSGYIALGTLATSIKAAMAAASFKSVLIIERDLYDSEVNLYRKLMDFSIWHTA